VKLLIVLGFVMGNHLGVVRPALVMLISHAVETYDEYRCTELTL
jgi:hypothetical protein